jgi:hypothetical protein
MATHRLEPVNGVVPVIVAFHDTNDFTASHMTDYLQILVDAARETVCRWPIRRSIPIQAPPNKPPSPVPRQGCTHAKAGPDPVHGRLPLCEAGTYGIVPEVLR